MEPEKFDKKRMDDLFKSFGFNFIVPSNSGVFLHRRQETVEQMTARLDEADAVIDAMTSYPTAKKMLDELFAKNSW